VLDSNVAKHAIIIGGGMAGLSAANALLRGGCAVTLLEAKSRLGGRIHTIRENGLPVELGAEFLHGQSKTIQRALESARLTTHEVSIQNRLFENGKFTGINLWEKMSRLIHRINPRDPDCSFLKFLDAQDLNATDRAQAISFVQGFHAALTNRIGAHALLRGEIAAEKMEDTRQGRVNEG
jgi:protoporphyrinogen oxidase